MNIWILLLQVFCSLGQQTDVVGLPSTDHHVARDGLVRAGDLLLRLLDQGEDLLRAAAQNHALLCEHDFPGAFGPTDQQLFPQLLLHPFQLGGQGGLGDVQGLCRRRNALFPGYGKKIMQGTQFHRPSLLPGQYIALFHNRQLWNCIEYKYLSFPILGPTL